MVKQRPVLLTVIDGQGGKLGKQLIEKIKEVLPGCEITAIGTNATAAATMIKGGADAGATGENPVIVACRSADIIIGPVGIVIADSLLGEVTPAMAAVVGQSSAVKILIPINRCNNLIVGVPDLTVATLISQAVTMIEECIRALRP